MGDDIACVDLFCVLLVAQTRVRRLVACGSCIVLRCFVGWDYDCGGGFDGKEVSMETIFCVGFCAFMVGIAVGSTLVYCIMSAREDKVLECFEELSESFEKTMIYSMDKIYEYGQKVKELEEKQIKEYLDSNNGGVVC